MESNINSLEHHGLHRCPDKGLSGYHRYAGFGILAYNPHKIGAKLPAKQSHERKEPGRPVKKSRLRGNAVKGSDYLKFLN